MKQLLISLALVLFGSAHAAPPTPEQLTLMAHMVSECSGVMGRDVCTVMIDSTKCDSAPNPQACKLAAFREKYPNGLLVAGAGRFTADEYFLYQGAGNRMCDVIVRQCSVDYDGRGCRMARALWRQQ